MLVLVAYGSKRGGTEGLARMVAEGLRDEGLEAEVAEARRVSTLTGYDAVVVGGALYAQRWHRDAARLVRRHARELRRMPTFLFSSGPLDESAATKEIPPVPGVRDLMGLVGAGGHATFGGRLAPDATGFVAKAMVKKHAGDWRDIDDVRAWAHSVARVLKTGTAAAA